VRSLLLFLRAELSSEPRRLWKRTRRTADAPGTNMSWCAVEHCPMLLPQLTHHREARSRAAASQRRADCARHQRPMTALATAVWENPAACGLGPLDGSPAPFRGSMLTRPRRTRDGPLNACASVRCIMPLTLPWPMSMGSGRWGRTLCPGPEYRIAMSPPGAHRPRVPVLPWVRQRDNIILQWCRIVDAEVDCVVHDKRSRCADA
jgi:hypothetical protein